MNTFQRISMISGFRGACFLVRVRRNQALDGVGGGLCMNKYVMYMVEMGKREKQSSSWTLETQWC